MNFFKCLILLFNFYVLKKFNLILKLNKGKITKFIYIITIKNKLIKNFFKSKNSNQIIKLRIDT